MSWIILGGLFGLIVLTFFKVFPMYYENYKVKAVLQALRDDTDINPKSKQAIWESISKRLYIQDVRSVQREHLTATRKGGKTTVTISYETRDDYIANLFIGAKFTESVVIDR